MKKAIGRPRKTTWKYFESKVINWDESIEIKVRFDKKGKKYKIPTKIIIKKSELENFKHRM